MRTNRGGISKKPQIRAKVDWAIGEMKKPFTVYDLHPILKWSRGRRGAWIHCPTMVELGKYLGYLAAKGELVRIRLKHIDNRTGAKATLYAKRSWVDCEKWVNGDNSIGETRRGEANALLGVSRCPYRQTPL